MLPKPSSIVLACCLLVGSVDLIHANQGLGQGISYDESYSQRQTYNEDYRNGNNRNGQGLGQGYNNQNNQNGQGYNGYNNGNNQGLGQGYNNQNGQGLGQGYNGYNNGNNQGLGQGYNNRNSGHGVGRGYDTARYTEEGYAGLGRDRNYEQPRYNNNDDSRGLSPVPLNTNRRKRGLGQDVQPSGGLGQDVQPNGGLGQPQPQPQGLGQGAQPSGGLGQPQPQPQGLGQGTQPNLENQNGMGGSLRFRRYVEREPYRKSCNSYYGKYICYRLYEDDAAIPNDFTCWSTYLGKKNCTETETVLYLDRRNVEVDPTEVDRQFYPDENGRRIITDGSARRDRQRSEDDEFGAVEKNVHNRRQNERQLPNDE